MKAVVTKADNSGPELVERPIPTPGHGEVLLKIAAAGINGADLSQAKGRYPVPAGATDILGLEAAGEITALGAGVTQWKTGDKVCALLVGGGYAEYVAVPAVQCLPVPKTLSVVEAAALPECVITVWLNVFDLGGLKPGDRLLVHGGSSGIGTTAIQLGKAFGARVIITAGSQEKCDACVKLGADLAVNYKTSDFVAETKAFTAGNGANVILDMVGGDYIERNYEAAAVDGRIVQIAFLGSATATVNFQRIMLKRLVHTGSTLRARSVADKGVIAADLDARVSPLFRDGKVKPLIDSSFPLAKASEAHARMESSHHIGKIVLLT
jgi:NADPH2:quinone reductase